MLGHPIVSTSVHDNDDVLEYTTDPELIHERYGNRVDLVIDGGFGGNVPSTVIDCSNGEMILIRAGKGDPDLIL
jgi:tRNA A37 threonylcarbamoyladenosine synthetase subunit TsaC/SUA5/YrdC